MTVSIVVVSFNTRALLGRCLASIDAHPPRCPHDTVVVDNGSRDGSAGLVAARFPHVRLLALGANVGFAAANNRGFDATRGDHVLMLNADTELLPGTLDRLLDVLEADPSIGVAGPTERTAEGTRYPTICPFPDLGWALMSHSGLRRRFNRSRLVNPIRSVWEAALATGAPVDVDWLSGASLLLRRKALAEGGGLDEGFFFYAEETDLCRRLRTLGWRVAYVPAAEIVHHGGASTAAAPRGLLTLSGALGELRYFARHRPRWERLALRALLAGESLARLATAARDDPRRWAWREVLRAALGCRAALVTEEERCRS